MSETQEIFSKDEIEWFDEMAEVMERAVEKAKAENDRLGLDPDTCVGKVFPDSEPVAKKDK